MNMSWNVGPMLEQRFDSATLSALARAQSSVPLRRAGVLTEMLIVGVTACLAGKPALPTAILWGSRAGMNAATLRVVADVVIARETLFPFDFLATQPILAAIPAQQLFPCIENALYQPWNDDREMHWQRMRTLAAAWLQAGRCKRVLCGEVEPGKDEHRGRWQTLEKA